VLARESPATAVDDIDMLAALELPTTDDLPALQRGVQLALEIKQHLFDTYYHGVALASLQPTSATCAQHAPRAASLVWRSGASGKRGGSAAYAQRSHHEYPGLICETAHIVCKARCLDADAVERISLLPGFKVLLLFLAPLAAQ
jgi:hypothetical protein